MFHLINHRILGLLDLEKREKFNTSKKTITISKTNRALFEKLLITILP